MLRAAARLNLPIRWLPERLAEQNWNLEEPPVRASPWVGVALGHARALRQRLDSAQGLAPRNIDQVLHAAQRAVYVWSAHYLL